MEHIEYLKSVARPDWSCVLIHYHPLFVVLRIQILHIARITDHHRNIYDTCCKGSELLKFPLDFGKILPLKYGR